jgi:transcription-repair coupling factor (superfamily II helicase)
MRRGVRCSDDEDEATPQMGYFQRHQQMNSEQILLHLKDSLASARTDVIELTGLAGSCPAWLMARLLRTVSRPVLWVASDLKEAERTAVDLSAFTDVPVLVYPCHDSLPFVPLVPSSETIAQRIAALYHLATEDGPSVVVAAAQSLAEYTIPPSVLLNHVEYLQAGEEVEREALVRWLIDAGYEHTAVVQASGEFSVRGGILDLFPPSNSLPVRVDFLGDLVEEMRLFDPLSQRSAGDIQELAVLPAREIFLSQDLVEAAQERLVERAARYEWPARRIHELLQQLEARRLVEGQQALLPLVYAEPATIFDYLPDGAPVLIDQSEAVDRAVKTFWETAESTYDAAYHDHRVLYPLNSLLADPTDLERRIGQRTRWILRDLKIDAPRNHLPFRPADAEPEQLEIRSSLPDLPLFGGGPRKGEDPLAPVFERLKDWIENGDRVVIFVPGERQGKRIASLLAHYQVLDEADGGPPSYSAPLIEDPARSGLWIYCGQLSRGFTLPHEALVLVTEEELLGIREQGQKRKKKKTAALGDLTFEDLRPGQAIVHRDHGVGLYQGLVRLEAGGVPGEFLHLEYRAGDRLYLPVDRLGLIQKYVGVEGREPHLDKLGGSSWQLTKQKVKKAIYEIAHELVDLYAARKVREGFAFSPSDTMFRQFEAAFPYEETRDQATSIEEVLSDMGEPRPMDRLLCGDVGYGKTEVVMRAAFKAVEDGKQVAVLVPTTLLAEQHERTFRRRLQRFPVTVEALSRLKSRKEQKATLAKLSQGTVDVIIGTHRLLQADVAFRDLGLLVIDEEHRFGVKDKERLKRLRQTVDCLSLTATPIPRTLQLSLLGLRDLSVINTPPRDRLPIKTFMAEFDDALVKEAIGREVERGGQVFFVHNRIKGIHRLAEHIRALVPGSRVEVAHGQMEPAELENVMIRFVRGEVDCLVCTTIIESGIDIPSANTMIINRADGLGLADLYQLRGRVGRAGEQAYAYMLVGRVSDLGKESLNRLRAIMELSVAGGGFRLAMQDLKIRGAGNILGISQSGQIAEVGYELYLDLLHSAVEELKGVPVREEIDPEVNLRIPAFIPEDYVSDVEQRLLLYRRMARLADDEETREFVMELRDRFGEMPGEVGSLLEVMGIKRTLRSINVIRLDRSGVGGEDRLILTFGPSGPPDAERLIAEIQKHKALRLLPDGRLIMRLALKEKESRPLINVRLALHALGEKATRK